MSAKNKDNKNRWRNKTIAFRMSPEEAAELDSRIKLCGYGKRQDYIIESVLHQKIMAKGNPYMFVQFKTHLLMIKNKIENSHNLKDSEEIISCLNTMCEILKAFEERKD